jgi:hypothetical protein
MFRPDVVFLYIYSQASGRFEPRRDRKLGRHGSRFLGYQAHVCFLASYPIEDSGKENRRIKECPKGA